MHHSAKLSVLGLNDSIVLLKVKHILAHRTPIDSYSSS
jgi:hypothetical protein